MKKQRISIMTSCWDKNLEVRVKDNTVIQNEEARDKQIIESIFWVLMCSSTLLWHFSPSDPEDPELRKAKSGQRDLESIAPHFLICKMHRRPLPSFQVLILKETRNIPKWEGVLVFRGRFACFLVPPFFFCHNGGTQCTFFKTKILPLCWHLVSKSEFTDFLKARIRDQKCWG